MDDGSISVRDSLKAATAELSGDAVEPVIAPAPEPVAEAVPAEPTAEAKTPAPEGRDEKGRFAPKESKAEASAQAPPAAPTTETAPPADKEPLEAEAIRVPPSLPAAVKAQFKDLAPEVREAFVKLEDSVQTAKAEWGKKGERLNRYDEIMAPRSEKLTLQGIDEFTAIKTLFAAQDFLERDPLGGIRYLAQSYGVNLTQLAPQTNAPQPGVEGQPAPTTDPRIEAMLQPLVRQVQTLEQRYQAETQRTEAQNLATAQAEVADFKGKPENMYFDNVKDDVVRRLESGAAKTLADAYEQAIWASPEVRPLLLKAQTVDAARTNAPAAAATKARTAANASGSVTGAPSAGAVAPAGPPGSVRDSIMAAREQLGAV